MQSNVAILLYGKKTLFYSTGDKVVVCDKKQLYIYRWKNGIRNEDRYNFLNVFMMRAHHILYYYLELHTDCSC